MRDSKCRDPPQVGGAVNCMCRACSESLLATPCSRRLLEIMQEVGGMRSGKQWLQSGRVKGGSGQR